MESFSPLIKRSLLPIPKGDVLVVRDDLLPGGTKQRASAPFLMDLMKEGHEEFVYASPFAGFAQVALSFTAQKLGARCTLICERDKSVPGIKPHPFTQLAQVYGAEIHLVETLAEAEELAQEIALKKNGYKVPLGFDTPLFKQHLIKELRQQWDELQRLSLKKITSLWLPLGSGTLARAFDEVAPKEVAINCVNVHVLESQDERIQSLSRVKRIKLYQAPMSFHEKAKALPKIPSNLFYDAKLWDFIKLHAEDKAVWWNVAR